MIKSAKLNAIDRREFLKAAGLSAVVASTAGTAAALLVERNSMSLVPPPSIRTAELLESSETSHVSSVLSDLMKAQIENARLRTELQAARRKLTLTNLTQEGQEDQIAKTLQSQLDESVSQNDSLTERVTLLTGLLGLYEQLESIDLAEIAGEGASSLEEYIGEIAEQVPSVQDGLQMGQEALDQLESQIPGLETGRQWLVEQFDAIGERFEDLEQTLKKSVKGPGTILQQLGHWFQSLLDWLPFGIGDSASATMDNIANLVNDILNTQDGVDPKLVVALDDLVKKDGDVTVLQSQVINPVRDQALTPAKKVIGQAAELQTFLTSHLIDPLALATNQQKNYRELIAEFKESHQI